MNRDKKRRVSLWVAGCTCIAVLLFVGIASWTTTANQSDKNEVKASAPTKDSEEASAKVIVTQDDLEAAEKSLDELDFSDSSAESAELQAEL